MSLTQITFAPYLPWPVLAFLAVAGLSVVAYGIWRRASGGLWRAAFVALALLALANPQLIAEEREGLADTVVLLVDETASARIGERAAMIEEARRVLVERLDDIAGVEIEEVRVTDDGREGSLLFGALRERLAEIDRTRLGAVLALTDGIAHDVPTEPDRLELGAPFHTLLAGRADEIDRKLVIEQAPTFGLLGEPLSIVLRVDDLPASSGEPVAVEIDKDGRPFTVVLAVPGEPVTVPVELEKAGRSVIEARAAPLAGELTLLNNRATVTINGIRDRLRVLLVSGQPYPGLRVWRNLLKADPAVDLVHFTILRPPEKQDGTPIRELALIAFPSRELFEVKLPEFDLIIFDRYARRGLLPLVYLDNVARYVEQGGALLDAAGPELAGPMSLFRTPLSRVMPGRPSGEVFERGFSPRITELGALHPVTAGLGDGEWGRWFRQVDVETNTGQVLMTGVADRPLLLLERVGEGRIAQLLSDHAWLWARGFEGGGPQALLLRRLVHWLMREPELEEEALLARGDADGLVIERRSLDSRAVEVEIESPSGERTTLPLEVDEDGMARGRMEAQEDGVYRIEHGDLVAYASPRRISSVEMTDLRATAELIAPVTEASHGTAGWLGESGVPELRRVAEGRSTQGRGWIGISDRDAHKVTGITQTALLPPWLALFLLLATATVAWWREGRG